MYDSPAGAVALYQGALYQLLQNAGGVSATSDSLARGAFVTAILVSGELTDELTAYGWTSGSVDSRTLPGPDAKTDGVYSVLQQTRGWAMYARGALARYAPEEMDLRAELYVVQGYAEVLLADLFCSGVPLSTLDYGADYTYHSGSTTQEVYQHAVILFDSALALVKDSARVRDWARVSKGRALLALGEYAAAGQTVKAVSAGFTMQSGVNWHSYADFDLLYLNGVSAVTREGGRGLPYFDDPRTTSARACPISYSRLCDFPVKYGHGWDAATTMPVVLADWIEARLIEAEAELHADTASSRTTWLSTLNALRAAATVSGQTGPLAPLDDPAPGRSDSTAFAARADLLFAERGYWLYLTAHRQGDLRRLVRAYGRRQDLVYPSGAYARGGGGARYGSDVTAMIPESEHLNPKFAGCLSRRA